MQFIKKNYEKILLGLVLVGMVVVAVFLLLLVSNEKQAQAERRGDIFSRVPKPLPPPDLGPVEALVRQAAVAKVLNFSDSTHKLLNPERWQKRPDQTIFKNPAGTEPKIEITKITNLYFTLALESVNATAGDTAVRYSISVQQEAAPKPNQRGRITKYASKGEKIPYGDKKESFLVKDIEGPPENPTAVVLELSDPEQTVRVNSGNPYRRVDGYQASLRYIPENRPFANRREGDKILIGGEEYKIVTITENEVILRGSNQKNWTIKYNAVP